LIEPLIKNNDPDLGSTQFLENLKILDADYVNKLKETEQSIIRELTNAYANINTSAQPQSEDLDYEEIDSDYDVRMFNADPTHASTSNTNPQNPNQMNNKRRRKINEGKLIKPSKKTKND
jgi:hypothetical protein